ncbi:MAG: hypothetical protein ABJA02_02865 [Acidobacteriota bacterium]
MISKAFAFFTAAILLLNTVAFASADTHGRKSKKRDSNALVALLPASDGVATFDAHRFFNSAMPQILSKNQPLLAQITAHMTEIETRTGIDLKKFDSLVVGLGITKLAPKKFTVDPVAIARGDIRAGALISVAKLASNGTYREEKYGERTIYVFSTEAAAKTAAAKGPQAASMISGALDSLTHEVAVSALDDNTLVFGSPARVRETLDAKTQVSPEVVGLLSAKESSVVTFAVRTPEGMSSLLPLENDELGNNIDSIKFVAGTMDVDAAGAAMQVTARTARPEQAKNLYDTLDGLKMLGKAFLGGSKRADQQVYGKLIENAKIGLRGSTVTLDLIIPQADIDVMIASVH